MKTCRLEKWEMEQQIFADYLIVPCKKGEKENGHDSSMPHPSVIPMSLEYLLLLIQDTFLQ